MKQTIKRHLNKRKYTRKLRKLRKKYTRNMRKATRNLLKKSRRFMKKTYKLQEGGRRTGKGRHQRHAVARGGDQKTRARARKRREQWLRDHAAAAEDTDGEETAEQRPPSDQPQAMPTAEEAGIFFDGLRTRSQAQAQVKPRLLDGLVEDRQKNEAEAGVPKAEAEVIEARCQVPFIIKDGKIKYEDKLKDRIEEIVNRDECYSKKKI